MIIDFFKALIIGATMLVPGVSGGSMAMILGIYQKLITSVSQLKQHFKKNSLFLGIFCVGGLLGVLLFAKPMATLIESYPMLTLYFFIGAVLGGIPLIIKESKVTKLSLPNILYIVVGFGLVFALSTLSFSNTSATYATDFVGMIYLLIAGIIAAVALVLPGISVSYLLLVMGLYDPLMKAINDLNMFFLLPLAIGIVIGILLSTKILEYIMNQFPKITYMVILGFVLGSLIELFPGLPSSSEWFASVICLLAGMLSIYGLSKIQK